MKGNRVLLFALLGWAGAASAAAADVAAGFDAANRLYEQGRFADAAVEYQKLIESGPPAPALYFNLGNAFFKAGAAGRAIAAYRQAQQIAPRDPDVRANLQFVRGQVQGPTRQPGRWERGLQRLTANEWTVLASVALWMWLLLLAAIQLRPAWKSSLRSLVWLSGTATVLLAAGLGAALSVDSNRTAIVTVRDAAVHNGPLEESPGVLTVHDGAEVQVVDRKDDWFQVSVADRTGWLKRDQVILVPR